MIKMICNGEIMKILDICKENRKRIQIFIENKHIIIWKHLRIGHVYITDKKKISLRFPFKISKSITRERIE